MDCFKTLEVELRDSDSSVIDEVIKHVKPHWSTKSRITCEKFTAGNTNVLYCVSYTKSPGNTGIHRESSKSTDLCEDLVLVRIYSAISCKYVDRKHEMEILRVLQQNKLFAKIHCAFKNGMCYDFIPGQTVSPAQMSLFYKEISCKVAELHCVPIPNSKLDSTIQPMLQVTLTKLSSLYPEALKILRKQHHLSRCSFIPSHEEIKSVCENLMTQARNRNKLPLVLCHNDLLCNNIVYRQVDEATEISFIDYEYSGLNYYLFDVANHFCEYIGVDEIDVLRIPSNDQKLDWLKNYFSSFCKLKPIFKFPNIDSDEFIRQELSSVPYYEMCSHILWFMWSVSQSAYSSKAMYFLRYAEIRIQEYQKILKSLV